MMKSYTSLNIIIVDDEEDWLSTFKDWIKEAYGFTVETYNNFTEAEKRLSKKQPYDLAIIDIYPENDFYEKGLELATYVKKYKKIPVIIVTGKEHNFKRNIRKSFIEINVNNFFFKAEDSRLHFLQFVADALQHSANPQNAFEIRNMLKIKDDDFKLEVHKNRRVFLGHGRSLLWRELKDFLKDNLKLEYEEFDRIPAAGKSISERLDEMILSCDFAVIIMTAEDEHSDGKLHPRENVIHELGLFQGRLGRNKAIILLEDGCEEFTNISGLVQIRFPKDNIKARFIDIQEVLKRENII